MFPTDAKLINRARQTSVRRRRPRRRPSPESTAAPPPLRLITHQRYAHAHQFKLASKALRKLRTHPRPGRNSWTSAVGLLGTMPCKEVFASPHQRGPPRQDQDRRQRGVKPDSLHAPEVECIGKGKAHRPYEFGVKVSVATPLHRCTRADSLSPMSQRSPATQRDGHTLATVIPAMEAIPGNTIERANLNPMPDTADTTRCQITSSRSTPPVKSAASPHFKGSERPPLS